MGAIRVEESGVTEPTRGALIVRIIVTLGEAADEALKAVLGWAEVVKVALLCAGAGGANAVGETV